MDQSESKRRSLARVWIGTRRRVAVSTDVSAVMERWLGKKYVSLNLSCTEELGGRDKRDRKKKRKEKEETSGDGEERTVCERPRRRRVL